MFTVLFISRSSLTTTTTTTTRKMKRNGRKLEARENELFMPQKYAPQSIEK